MSRTKFQGRFLSSIINRLMTFRLMKFCPNACRLETLKLASSEMIMIYYLSKFWRCFDLIYLFYVRQYWCWFILIRHWWCNQSWPSRSVHFTRIDFVDSPRFSLCTFVLPCITIHRTVRRFVVQYIPRNMHTVLVCFALLWLCNRS